MDGGGLTLPAGFRFHPTDEELARHYLCRKCSGAPIPVPIIAEIDLYKYDPWRLPGMAVYGEKEWYFFTPRDRKYPNGSRPNRAAGSGYWKATGADKPVGSPRPVAIKKALVFYVGKAPKGDKTNWIMHEYRLADVDHSVRKRHSLRLDEWVLCRIYNKKEKGGAEKAAAAAAVAGARSMGPPPPAAAAQPQAVSLADLFCFDGTESLPMLHGESSCSEHVRSPEFGEVESEMRWGELERALEIGGGGGMFPALDDPLQDMFMYLQKPF